MIGICVALGLDKDLILKEYSENYWDLLNPKLANGKGLYRNALINKIKRANEDFEAFYAKRIPKHESCLIKDFIAIISDEGYLKEMIFSKPDGFNKIAENLESVIDFSLSDNHKAIVSFKGFLLENIFNYEYFRSRKFNSIFSYGIFKELLYCPYCNIQEIQFIKSEVKRKSGVATEYQALFDLDHFLLKSKYPYFSLSFFNLIPCCAVCNSRIRGSKDFFMGKNYHPYNDNFDDICVFKIDVDSYLSNKEDISIVLNSGYKSFQKTIDDMHLISLYSTNNREHLKAIVDNYRNNQTYSFLNPDIGLIKTLKANFFKSHIPFSKKNILKKSRGKMLRDVFRESVDLKYEYPFDD